MEKSALVKKYGTPFFLLDVTKLRDRINYLRKFISKDIDLVYAVKANTFLIPYIKDLIEKVELCSFGEYEIAVASQVPDEKMVISGVYKDEASIRYMFEHSKPGKFTLESLNQFELLSKLAKEYNKKIDCLIRLTSGNQFGMSESDTRYVIEHYDKKYLNIKGIEYFNKTQRHSIPILERELIKVNEFMETLEKEYQITLEEFEYGPGFPVYYFEGSNFNEDEFLSEFSRIIKHIKNKKISLELGRSIAATTGEYLTSVVDIKTNKSGTYALVDGGINHLVYYGGNMAMNTPYNEVIPKREGNDTYIVVGSLCTINDILIKEYHPGHLELGDVIVFKNTGAYSTTEGISLFLSRELPKVIIKNGDNIELVRSNIKTSKLNNPNEERNVL